MNNLYMVEMILDQGALFRFLGGQGLAESRGDQDLGYGVHAWLRAAFGEYAPKPWRLLLSNRRPSRVLGYSRHAATALSEHARAFAGPQAFAVCPPESVAGKLMPEWRSGLRIGFEVLCCPVGRKSSHGTEKDLFLVHAEAAGDAGLSREPIYCQWAREQIERDGAGTVNDIRLNGFRLVRQSRQTQAQAAVPGGRKRVHVVRPQALISGTLTVGKPDAFRALLGRGLGRHRAFGYGMLLLRPASCA